MRPPTRSTTRIGTKNQSTPQRAFPSPNEHSYTLHHKNRNGKSVITATRFPGPNAHSYTLDPKNRNAKSVNPATRFPGLNAPSYTLCTKNRNGKPNKNPLILSICSLPP